MAPVRGVSTTPAPAAARKAEGPSISPELRAAADAIAAEWPGNKAFAAGLEDRLAHSGRMKDENRALALHHFAGEFVAQKLGLTPESEPKLADALGKHPKSRTTIVDLLAQFPAGDGFMKALRKELRHAFPELAGSPKRTTENEQVASLNHFANTWAMSSEALGPTVYAEVEKLIAEHPHDDNFLRGLRELVRIFPRRRALTGSMPQSEELTALHRYAAKFKESAKLKESLATGGVQRTGPLGSNAPGADEKPFTPGALEHLKAAFTPEAMGFFSLYGAMQDVARGQQVPADLVQRLDDALTALNRMVSPKDKRRISADVLNEVRRGLDELKAIAGKLTPNAAVENPRLLDQFRMGYQGLVLQLANDKGVHLTQIAREKGTWGDFRMMNERQAGFAALIESDPQVAAILEQRKLTYQQIDTAIHAEVLADGRVPRQFHKMGRIITIGVNPKDETDQLVYDLDGTKRTWPEFKEYRAHFLDSMRRLAKEPDETDVPLSSLRSLSDAELKKIEGEVEAVAITDDKAKQSQLTRIYDTKWVDGQRVVVSGRFKGIYLDDLVNANGRLIEGAAYRYDERRGKVHGLPVKQNPAEREPYATLTHVKEHGHRKEVLFLQLPHLRGEWTEVRQAMRRLTEGKGAVPTIKYETGSRNSHFYFEPKDFAAVRDAIGGMSLSSAAVKHLDAYFSELVKGDRAVTEKNIENFSEKNIPGFLPEVKLLTPQKEAMAWLEANGNHGVIALDTGIGKTLTAIAQMQKLLRDGYDHEKGSNGRFLYVAPKALIGNVKAEIFKFLDPTTAQALVDRLDVVSYEQLRDATKDGKLDGKVFDPKKYVSAFFDEAQDVNRDTGSMKSRAALGFDNPRKVVLTASPMETSPMDAYVLDAIASNVDLRDPKQRDQHLTEMKRFRERYVETFGGRVVGLKKDPIVREELHTWMKQRVFFRDKNQVPEFELPQLNQVKLKPLLMSKEHAELYKAAARDVQAAVRGLVSIYRDEGLVVGATDAQGNPVRKVSSAAKNKKLREKKAEVARAMRRLRLLATAPAAAIPPEVAAHPEIPANAALIKKYEALGYPTIDAAVRKMKARPADSRAAVWAENPDIVIESARAMSKKIPGLHAAALGDKIFIFQNGHKLEELNGHQLPFHKKKYHRDLTKPVSLDNRSYDPEDWQQFVMREILMPDDQVKTVTMQRHVYNEGQNLQQLDAVMNIETVGDAQAKSQAIARVERQGNHSEQVDVYDFVAALPDELDANGVPVEKNDLDLTIPQLDELTVQVFQDLFDEMVKESQQTELGKAWFEQIEHKQASTMMVDRDRLELLFSPYLRRVLEAA